MKGAKKKIARKKVTTKKKVVKKIARRVDRDRYRIPSDMEMACALFRGMLAIELDSLKEEIREELSDLRRVVHNSKRRAS